MRLPSVRSLLEHLRTTAPANVKSQFEEFAAMSPADQLEVIFYLTTYHHSALKALLPVSQKTHNTKEFLQ